MTDRGVSVALDYIMLLMIATVMLAGVVAVAGSLIDDQVERGVENEMEVTGESLAADIQEVERLANATDTQNTTIELTVSLPSHVSGEAYTIGIDNGDTLVLESTGTDIRVKVPVAAERLVGDSDAIPGGDIRLKVVDGRIEVTEA